LHGPRQHSEGILLADAIERGDSLEHGFPRQLFTGRQFSPSVR
jgi:hypothetical protein